MGGGEQIKHTKVKYDIIWRHLFIYLFYSYTDLGDDMSYFPEMTIIIGEMKIEHVTHCSYIWPKLTHRRCGTAFALQAGRLIRIPVEQT